MSLITTEKHRNVQQICSKHIGLPELTPTTKRPTPLYEEALGISASDSIRRAKLTMKIICTMTEGACNSQLCISHGSHRQSEAMASVSFAEGFLPSMRGATRRTALLHRFPRGMATGRWLRRGLWCCAAAAARDPPRAQLCCTGSQGAWPLVDGCGEGCGAAPQLRQWTRGPTGRAGMLHRFPRGIAAGQWLRRGL